MGVRDFEQDAEARLAEVISMIANATGDEAIAAFNQVQANWLSFCESWVALKVGDRSRGGTIWPVLYSGLKRSMTERWIDDLQEYRDRGEGEI